MRQPWPILAVALGLSAASLSAAGGASAQPLEQRFGFGAPPDVLGNRRIGRLAPVTEHAASPVSVRPLGRRVSHRRAIRPSRS